MTESPPVGCAVGIVNDNIAVHLGVAELVDAESEIAKLRKKQEETQKYTRLNENNIQMFGN